MSKEVALPKSDIKILGLPERANHVLGLFGVETVIELLSLSHLLLLFMFRGDREDTRAVEVILEEKNLSLGRKILEEEKPKIKTDHLLSLSLPVQETLTRSNLTTTLRKNGIVFMGDLVYMSRTDAFELAGVGRGGLIDIYRALKEKGFSFSMSIEGWVRPPYGDIQSKMDYVQRVYEAEILKAKKYRDKELKELEKKKNVGICDDCGEPGPVVNREGWHGERVEEWWICPACTEAAQG